jgi:KinB signaling pathway activation protein
LKYDYFYCSQTYRFLCEKEKEHSLFIYFIGKIVKYIHFGGVQAVTIRNWVKFAFWALLIGGGVTAVASLFIRWNFYKPFIMNGEIGEFLAAFVWMGVLGFTMSMIAQAGFFAYLTLHQIGVNVFKSLTLWNWVQVLIIFIVLIDLIIFRFSPGADSAKDWAIYIGLLLILVGGAIATAVKKVQLTGKPHILIPTIFFMIVVTSLEWIIALMGRQENIDTYVTLLLFPLVAVNAFQILMLPKYNLQSEIDRKNLEERRKARREAAQLTNASETKVSSVVNKKTTLDAPHNKRNHNKGSKNKKAKDLAKSN